MKKDVCLGALLLLALGVGAGAHVQPQRVEDKTLRGRCTLKTRVVWELQGLEGEPLPGLDQVRTLPDGGGALWSLMGEQILLLNADGTLRGRFGKKGEGPGCWRMVEEVLGSPGALWVVDNDRLHRFTLQGRWQADHRLPPRFRPVCLADDTTVLGWVQGGGEGERQRAVWRIGTDRPVLRGAVGTPVPGPAARMNGMQVAIEIPGLTPGFFMAWGAGRWVFGQNERYALAWENLAGGEQGALELTGRALQPLPPSLKETYRPWAASLPSACTPWRGLAVDGQLRIWVEVTPVGEEHRLCWDLFSPQGALLWRVDWGVGAGMTLKGWDRVGDALLLLLEDEAGELRIRRVLLDLRNLT